MGLVKGEMGRCLGLGCFYGLWRVASGEVVSAGGCHSVGLLKAAWMPARYWEAATQSALFSWLTRAAPFPWISPIVGKPFVGRRAIVAARGAAHADSCKS